MGSVNKFKIKPL